MITLNRFLRPAVLGAISLMLCVPTLAASKRRYAPVSLSLHTMDGKKISLNSFHGQIVVVNFWATWCGPCQAEMPLVNQAAQRFKDKGVAFIGASVDDASTRANVLNFVRRYQPDYTICIDSTAHDLQKLGLGVAVPATAILDRRGLIVYRILGQLRPSELDELLERMETSTDDQSDPVTISHLSH